VLVNLNLSDKEVLVPGGGNVCERRSLNFLREGCNVVAGSIDFTKGLRQSNRNDRRKLVQLDASSEPDKLDKLVASADIVVASTNEYTLNQEIIAKAKENRALVCVVDNPPNSDFSPIAITNVLGIQITVYTAGKSPAIARMLRERVEKTITQQDILQVELLHYAKGPAKTRISNSKVRQALMYRILEDEEINAMWKKGSLEEARRLVKEVIENY